MNPYDNLGKRAEAKVAAIFMGNNWTFNIFHVEEIGGKFPLVDILAMRLRKKACFFIQVKGISSKTKNQDKYKFKGKDIKEMKKLNVPCYLAVYKESNQDVHVVRVGEMRTNTLTLTNANRVPTDAAGLKKLLTNISRSI